MRSDTSGQSSQVPPSDAPSSMRHGLTLAAILVAAILLRFYGITQAGIFSVDEGRYLLDAQSKQIELGVYADLARGKLAEVRGGEPFLLEQFVPEARDALARRAPFLPKVLFSYLAALVMGIVGFKIWAASVVEAAFGVLTVGAVYLLARRLRNPRTALIAAGMLALSCYHVYFSRNAYPQCTSGFFLVLAVLLHLHWSAAHDPRGTYRHLVASGLCAGLAFLANFQAGGALPLLVVIHIGVSLRDGSAGVRIRRLAGGGACLLLGFAAALIAAEATTYPLILLFRSQDIAYAHHTFFELLLPRLTMHTHIPANGQGVALFPYFVYLFEGPIALGAMLLLAVAGAWAAIGARGRREAEDTASGRTAWLYLTPALLVPWLIFSFKTLQAARTFTYLYPFLAIALAISADALWQVPAPRRRAARVVTAALLALAAASALRHDAEVLQTRSAYPRAMDFIAQTPEHAACAAWSAVLLGYLEEGGLDGGSYYDYAAPDKSLPPYFLTDWQELYHSHYPDECSVIPAGSEPDHVLHHQFGRILLETEAFPAYDRTFSSIAFVRALDLDRARKLLLYDLRRTGSEK